MPGVVGAWPGAERLRCEGDAGAAIVLNGAPCLRSTGLASRPPLLSCLAARGRGARAVCFLPLLPSIRSARRPLPWNEVSGFAFGAAATGLHNPDFAALAESCGAVGLRVEHVAEVEPVLRRAAVESRPVVVDARVTPGELTMPPSVGFAQVWGFGLSKLKEGLLGLGGDHSQWENWKREFQANLAS